MNAAFPEETRKQCLTPKCSFSSRLEALQLLLAAKHTRKGPKRLPRCRSESLPAVGFFLCAFTQYAGRQLTS